MRVLYARKPLGVTAALSRRRCDADRKKRTTPAIVDADAGATISSCEASAAEITIIKPFAAVFCCQRKIEEPGRRTGGSLAQASMHPGSGGGCCHRLYSLMRFRSLKDGAEGSRDHRRNISRVFSAGIEQLGNRSTFAASARRGEIWHLCQTRSSTLRHRRKISDVCRLNERLLGCAPLFSSCW